MSPSTAMHGKSLIDHTNPERWRGELRRRTVGTQEDWAAVMQVYVNAVTMDPNLPISSLIEYNDADPKTRDERIKLAVAWGADHPDYPGKYFDGDSPEKAGV